MAAKDILPALACILLIAALTRMGNVSQARTWLQIAAIFGVVSLWLFARLIER